MYNVIRTFGIDYIYFDLIFVILFLALLVYRKKTLPLLAFFVGGILINFLIDWGIWLHTGIRELALPSGFLTNVLLPTKLFIFMFWFSLTYGVEYAYVFLMFEKKSNKVFWTLLILLGWLAIGFLSQHISINDMIITTNRHMSDFRIYRIFLVLIGYGLLFLFGYKWKQILYLFLVGFVIHFMMEFSLLVSGIRPGSFAILLENSFIEFNMGVPFFYLLYDKVLKRRFENKVIS